MGIVQYNCKCIGPCPYCMANYDANKNKFYDPQTIQLFISMAYFTNVWHCYMPPCRLNSIYLSVHAGHHAVIAACYGKFTMLTILWYLYYISPNCISTTKQCNPACAVI